MRPTLTVHSTQVDVGILEQLRFSPQISPLQTLSITIHPYSLTVLANILHHTSDLEHACWHFNNQDRPLPCRKCKKPTTTPQP